MRPKRKFPLPARERHFDLSRADVKRNFHGTEDARMQNPIELPTICRLFDSIARFVRAFNQARMQTETGTKPMSITHDLSDGDLALLLKADRDKGIEQVDRQYRPRILAWIKRETKVLLI
jgi:hypothetical protein